MRIHLFHEKSSYSYSLDTLWLFILIPFLSRQSYICYYFWTAKAWRVSWFTWSSLAPKLYILENSKDYDFDRKNSSSHLTFSILLSLSMFQGKKCLSTNNTMQISIFKKIWKGSKLFLRPLHENRLRWTELRKKKNLSSDLETWLRSPLDLKSSLSIDMLGALRLC